MKNNYKQPKTFFPIGTVVRLKNAKKCLMITGFLATPNGIEEEMCDYCGCFYPEGILKTDQVFLFNHKQIETVLFKGYANGDEKKFKKNLKTWLNTIEKIDEDKK